MNTSAPKSYPTARLSTAYSAMICGLLLLQRGPREAGRQVPHLEGGGEAVCQGRGAASQGEHHTTGISYSSSVPHTYKDAGVDIDAGDALVQRIKGHARATLRPEVLAGIGGFSGLCALPSGMKDPILVSGTDGVGTKLKTAFATGRHDTVGIDLVAMCVNDVAVPAPSRCSSWTTSPPASSRWRGRAGHRRHRRGVPPGRLRAPRAARPPSCRACMRAGEYDLAGFAVGVVERAAVRDGRSIAVGDALVGIASSGLHSNGYSLARKLLLEVARHAARRTPRGAGRRARRRRAPRARRGSTWRRCARCRARGDAGGRRAHHRRRPRRKTRRASCRTAARWRCASDPDLAGAADLPVPRSGWAVEEHEMRRTFNMGLGHGRVRAPRTNLPGDPAPGAGRRARLPRRRSRRRDRRGRVRAVNARRSGIGQRHQPAGAARCRARRAPRSRPHRLRGLEPPRRAARSSGRRQPASRRSSWITRPFRAATPSRTRCSGARRPRASRPSCLAGLHARPQPRASWTASPDRILNIHPSLLPAFPGVDAQAPGAGARGQGDRLHGALRGARRRRRAHRAAGRGPGRGRRHRRLPARAHPGGGARILPRAVQLLAAGKLRRDGRRAPVTA